MGFKNKLLYLPHIALKSKVKEAKVTHICSNWHTHFIYKYLELIHSLIGKWDHCPLRSVWLSGPIFKFYLLILIKVQTSEILKSAERGSRGWEDVRTEEQKHFSSLAGLLLGPTAA